MKIVSCLILAGFFGAYVESTTTGDVRLVEGSLQGSGYVEGSSQGSGYVEVYYHGQWNAVCTDYADYGAGNAACKQLGYRQVSRATEGYNYPGSSSDSITVNCYGVEDRMDECSINSNCYSSYRLFVECTTEPTTVTIGDVRLVGESSPGSGYVEVYYNGQWNNVSVGTPADVEGYVACMQLGYRLVNKATKGYYNLGLSYYYYYYYINYRLVVECTNAYTPHVWTILIPLVCGLIVLCVLCVVAYCLYRKKKPRQSPVPGNTAEGTIPSVPSHGQGGTGHNLPPSTERRPHDDTYQYNAPSQDVNRGQRSGVQSSEVNQVPLEPLVSFPEPTEAESQNNENEPLLSQFD